MVRKFYKTIDDKIFDDEATALEHEKNLQGPRSVSFTGASDDIITVSSSDNQSDEVYLGSTLEIVTPDGTIKVTPIYDGCWTFALGLADESAGWIELNPAYTLEHEYSLRLTVDLPHGAHVRSYDGDAYTVVV